MTKDPRKPPPPPPPEEFEEDLPSDLSSIAEAIASTAGRKAVEMTPELMREAVVEALRGLTEGDSNLYDLGVVQVLEASAEGHIVLKLSDAGVRERVEEAVRRVFGVTELVFR